jgi:DNA-binding LacI/PurR family transcriptional regulator
VDGFVLVRTRCQDPRIDFLRETGVPFVAFGRTEGELDYPYVDEDGEEGMLQLTRHLIEHGHRRIAYISPPLTLMFARHRMQGVKRALEEADIPLPEAYRVTGELTQRSGREAARQLLALPQPPTAIIAGNDLMALGAMSAIQERGLIVGRDIAVAGFDDIPMSEATHPPLTTVHQPIYQIGSLVAEILIQLIRGETPEQTQYLLKPQLVIRQSCGLQVGSNTHSMT